MIQHLLVLIVVDVVVVVVAAAAAVNDDDNIKGAVVQGIILYNNSDTYPSRKQGIILTHKCLNVLISPDKKYLTVRGVTH